MSKILIVHPYDRSTFFLKRISNYLISSFNDKIHYFSVKTNRHSHDECLKEIQSHPENGLIIFLGHGRSDKLYGAKSDTFGEMVSLDYSTEHESVNFYEDDFINSLNLGIFKNKHIFCLSCNSNDKIAKIAVEKGALSFIGFGDIPTSLQEFAAHGDYAGLRLVVMMKSEVNFIIKNAIYYSLKNKLTFDELVNIIVLITNQRISRLLLNETNLRFRTLLVDHLYFFKKDIVILGNKSERLNYY